MPRISRDAQDSTLQLARRVAYGSVRPEQRSRVRIGYFVHDLSDPAVGRRVQMLQAGGAEVVVFGFRRTDELVATVAGARAVDLGRTYDARLADRAFSVLRALLIVRRWGRGVTGASVILARNLEMLVLARAARRFAARQASLNYELLDVHRLLVGRSILSSCLRALEALLLRDASLTLVSSAAFVTNYFVKWSRPVGRVLVVENKVFEGQRQRREGARVRPSGPPWRIGWFGMLRCRRSLEMLIALALAADGLVKIEIRGRPSDAEFDNFTGQVSEVRNLTYHGPYDAADLPNLYGSVHFAWSIDFFEAGLNSSWLLPNRLYESQLYGAVPIALKDVETGRWLARRGAGLLLEDPAKELLPRLQALTPQAFDELARRTEAIAYGDLASEVGDCEALVRTLEERSRGA